MYNIWQDAGIRTRDAATAAKCATNELHTSLMQSSRLSSQELDLLGGPSPSRVVTDNLPQAGWLQITFPKQGVYR